MDDGTWTLAELAAEVAVALGDAAAPSGQARAVPDERAIRYYTTLGLLDRPALRGRTALYGRRHLAQIIAIKRLQAAGKSLAAIQALLPTVDDGELARIAGVTVPGRPRTAARAGFWRDDPAPVAAVAAPAAVAAAPAAAPAAPPAVGFQAQLALELAPGVVLHLAAGRAASDADADAVRAAAAPLLAELARRRLLA
jgi:DNA-binding transcriptional MerR regulator